MAEETVRNKSLLLVAGALGVLAVGLFYAYDYGQQQRYYGTMVKVMRWTRDVAAGTKIVEADIGEVLMPDNSVKPAKAIELKEKSTFLGSMLQQPVNKDEFLSFADIKGGAKGGVSRTINKGMRAVPILVSDKKTLGKVAQQGDRVDLVTVVPLAEGPKGMVLMQDLRLISIGGDPVREGDAAGPSTRVRTYRTIQVEASPEVAQKWAELEQRISEGKVWMILRNPDDRTNLFKDARGNDAVDKTTGMPLVINPLAESVLSQLPVKAESPTESEGP